MRNIRKQISNPEILPAFDPPQGGLFEAQRRMSFFIALDDTVPDDMETFAEELLPIFNTLNLPSATRFEDVIDIVELITGENRSSFTGGVEYTQRLTEWASERRIEVPWILQFLHERLELAAQFEVHHQLRLAGIESASPLGSIVDTASSLRSDTQALKEREGVIGEFYRLAGGSPEMTDITDKFDFILEAINDDRTIVDELENLWRSEKRSKLAAGKVSSFLTLVKNAHTSRIRLEFNDKSFNFHSAAWQFNQETEVQFRKAISQKFQSALKQYMEQVRRDAILRGYEEVSLPRKRNDLTPDDRMRMFVLYQVCRLSPSKCLSQLQQMSGDTDERWNITEQALMQHVQVISTELSIKLRRSKTKQK